MGPCMYRWFVFLISSGIRKNEIRHIGPFFSFRVHYEKRNTVRFPFFVFLTAYGMGKTSGATVVFPFFALLEMRNTKTGPGRISFSLLPVYDLYLLFDFLTGSCNWRGYSTMWIRCVTGVQWDAVRVDKLGSLFYIQQARYIACTNGQQV